MLGNNANPMGDAQLPDLISHLVAAWKAQNGVHESMTTPADSFILWAKDYLDKNRPSESFGISLNLGVQLTNGVRLKLCPGVNGFSEKMDGSMAGPDTSIGITSR